MQEIDFAYRTLFAELCQRSLDERFSVDFPLGGRFVTVTVKGHAYWYFDSPEQGRTKRRYVGPHADAEITRRVEGFDAVKDDVRSRRRLVSTLTRDAGLPSPERFTGDVVQAVSEAGFFRLRGVLVGTVAFQCYAGLLGVRLPSAALQTGDADFAQFHGVSASGGDSLPPVLGILQAVDPSFRQVPHQSDSGRSTKFRNATGYEVEFLTPNRGSSDHDGKAARMPALGGAAADPLRFLDFLIYEPARSMLLHRAGVGVTVPAPERFAVHKIIVAERRRNDGLGRLKRDKDLHQAALLSEALIQTRRAGELAGAFAEAWRRGPAWRKALRAGLHHLPLKQAAVVRAGLAAGLREIGEDPDLIAADASPAEPDGAV